MQYNKPIILLSISIALSIFLFSCSSDSEWNGNIDAGADTGMRKCKNSAQCNADEVCQNSICVKKEPRDAGDGGEVEDIYDIIHSDISEDISDTFIDVEILDGGDLTSDISDIGISTEYNLGISSIYEGTAGECSNDEYILKSVSGYSGMNTIENDEFTIISGARFK